MRDQEGFKMWKKMLPAEVQEIELEPATFVELQEFMLDGETFDKAVLRAVHLARYFLADGRGG